MSAEQIARGLGGAYHREGAWWRCKCPAHHGKTDNSLALLDDGARVIVMCHSGCDFRDVIRELRARGLWSGQERRQRYHRAQTRQPAPQKPLPPGPAQLPTGKWRSLA
jgi:hypothetical protein